MRSSPGRRLVPTGLNTGWCPHLAFDCVWKQKAWGGGGGEYWK